MSIKRYIQADLKASLSEKICLVSGPRQAGKTTVSKSLFESYTYLNFDNEMDRQTINKFAWARNVDLLIFDEIHKRKEWKRFIKGVYDKEGLSPKILVTGSAKLDTYRKVGDSLAGRYLRYRLHPLDLKELYKIDPEINTSEVLAQLLNYSGFPEPFLAQSTRRYKLWRTTHQDIILRQDLLDLEKVSNIKSIEILVELLSARVGSSCSYLSLARDLQVDSKTVKHWIEILENMYMLFKVTPYNRNIARSILKEPKYYFYDFASNKEDGVRFENLVACALLKECHRIQDTFGDKCELHYVKNNAGKEVDFLISINGEAKYLIECKLSDQNLSKNLPYFAQYFPNIKCIQLVKNARELKQYPNGMEIYPAHKWLVNLDLSLGLSF